MFNIQDKINYFGCVVAELYRGSMYDLSLLDVCPAFPAFRQTDLDLATPRSLKYKIEKRYSLAADQTQHAIAFSYFNQ